MLISFELSMPNVGSWNGKWSGESKVYAIVKNFRKPPFKLGLYSYNFGDGWRASIAVREVDKRTAAMLRKKSAGFCGYEWMVDSIIADGDIYGPEKPKPIADSTEKAHPDAL